VERPCRSATFFERIAPTRCRPEEASPCRTCTAKIAATLELYMKRLVPVESAYALIDERIKELRDWRGKTLAKVRQIIHEADPEIVKEAKYWRARADLQWRTFQSPLPSARVCTLPRPAFAASASADIQWGLRSIPEEQRHHRPDTGASSPSSPAPGAAAGTPIQRSIAPQVQRQVSRGRSWKSRRVFERFTRRKLLNSCPWTRKMKPSPSEKGSKHLIEIGQVEGNRARRSHE
jgi:hypothetical protein